MRIVIIIMIIIIIIVVVVVAGWWRIIVRQQNPTFSNILHVQALSNDLLISLRVTASFIHGQFCLGMNLLRLHFVWQIPSRRYHLHVPGNRCVWKSPRTAWFVLRWHRSLRRISDWWQIAAARRCGPFEQPRLDFTWNGGIETKIPRRIWNVARFQLEWHWFVGWFANSCLSKRVCRAEFLKYNSGILLRSLKSILFALNNHHTWLLKNPSKAKFWLSLMTSINANAQQFFVCDLQAPARQAKWASRNILQLISKTCFRRTFPCKGITVHLKASEIWTADSLWHPMLRFSLDRCHYWQL